MSWTEDVQWDLDSILPGGPQGAAFADRAAALERRVEALVLAADALGQPGVDPAYETLLPDLVQTGEEVAELHMFAMCYASTHAEDPNAWRAEARVSAVASRLHRAWTNPNDRLARCSEAAWAALRERPAVRELAPMVEDLRATAHLLLPPGEQALYADLYEDSIAAWGRLYEQVASRVAIPVGDELLSPAQALNRMDDPDPAVRAAVFQGVAAGWQPHAESCAEMLTHIYGVRGTIQRRLGVDELAPALAANRITRRTLDALLAACMDARPLVTRFLKAKARTLGQETIDWQDLRAPMGRITRAFGWSDAQDFVVGQFATFSEDMAAFARDAFSCRWVEAEDRRGKRPGAYCAPMPVSRQSRIFMTFGGRMNSVITLAHELGHAYHNHVIHQEHPARQRLTSALAETASTFAETLVRSAMLAAATDSQEQIAILDQDLGDALSFLANIPVRFEFERALHRLRGRGALVPDELSETMESLQRTWYGSTLGAAHPLFWADKLHFYIPDAPFYNFPYTFGYLFSSLVNHYATAKGQDWSQGYVALLRDTGAGPAEAVASRHLGVDLEDPATWQPVLARIEERLTRYERLVG